MTFEREELINLIKKNISFKQIDLSEIPDIDLYMDQVTTFMEDKLKEFKRTKQDKILTKTMINNYTKNKILPPPEKKKYSKDHMMLLILIYHLKQILSIGDIHSLLSSVSDISIENLYKNFTDIQSIECKNFSEEMPKKIDELQKQIHPNEENFDKLTLFSMIFFLIIQSSLEKRLAEKLIDTFFND